MQEGTDNMEHEIHALRMEIDNISSQQDNNVDDDVSYVYYEQDLDRDMNATPLLLLTGPESSSTDNQNQNENRNGEENGSDHPEASREMREANLRNALRINKEYQDFLNMQLRNIEMELHKNQELQKRYRAAIAQKEKPPTKRGHSNTTKRVPGNPYFIDQEGLRPPDNRDTIELKPELEKTALMYRFKKWSKAEVTSLAQAIRKQNSEHQFEKLLKELETGRITHERFDAEHAAIRRISDAELEANVEDIDWEEVASVVGSSRSAADCMIAWTNSESSAVNRSAWTKEEDTKLVKIAKKYRGFQWQAVAKELGTRRAPVQCLRRYQRNLNTNIMKTSWTPEEDQILAESVKKFGVGNWQQVANYLVGRTGQQCLHRWDKTLRPTIKKGRWNAEEDKKLLEAVELVGSTKSWIKISQYVPGRTDMQCRERWVNVLNPDLKRYTWTDDEDKLLQQAIAMFGLGKWSQVAGVVRSRTDNQCWRRWKSLNPDVVDNYREAIGKKKKKKSAKNNDTPATPDEPDDQELKRVAKRRKLDSKNSRKSNKALSDGIQSAAEPEELIRVFAQENATPPPAPPPAPQPETHFNVTLEPTPAKVRGRPKRNRVSWPQPRVVSTTAPAITPATTPAVSSPASPASPSSPPAPPAIPASPVSPASPPAPPAGVAPQPPAPSTPQAPRTVLAQALIPLVQPKAPASPALHAVSAYHALVAPPASPVFNVVPQSQELIVIPSSPSPPVRAPAKVPALPAQAIAKTPAQPMPAIAKTPARTPISARRINKRRIIREEVQSEEEESDGDTSADSNFEGDEDDENQEEDGEEEEEEQDNQK